MGADHRWFRSSLRPLLHWRTLQVNREGQITERFTRAIDQLGDTDDKQNPRLEIRIGGIYALERIAKDSQASDYSTVMEVLTAYVRTNAPLSASAGKPPRADIQAAFTVIGRREPARVPEQYQLRIDLNRTSLIGADLRGADLSEAKLDGANLKEADFHKADLSKARLSRADLTGADLRGTNGLDKKQISAATGSHQTTKLPKG